MCNTIHKDAVDPLPIPTSGFGYKIFRVYSHIPLPFHNFKLTATQYLSMYRNGSLVSMVGRNAYVVDENDWAVWNSSNVQVIQEGDGFCFFITMQEAYNALNAWVWEMTQWEPSSTQQSISRSLGVYAINYEDAHPFSFMEDLFVNKPVRMGICKKLKPTWGWVDTKRLEEVRSLQEYNKY